MDVAGYRAGIPERETKEPTYFSLSTSSSATQPIRVNEVLQRKQYFTPLKPPLPIKNDATGFPNPMRRVLPCKGEKEGVKYGKHERDLNAWQYPQTGYARGQKRGLATDFDKPMNKPIMPIPGFYNQDVKNALGGLK